MENKPLDKMQLNNKEQEIKKPVAQGEYGDKPFQNPKLDDKPADVIKKEMPKDTLEVDAGARNREENATKDAGKVGAAAEIKSEPINTTAQETAK